MGWGRPGADTLWIAGNLLFKKKKKNIHIYLAVLGKYICGGTQISLDLIAVACGI